MKVTFVVMGKARSMNNSKWKGMYRKQHIIEWQEEIGWCALKRIKRAMNDTEFQWKIHVDYFYIKGKEIDVDNPQKYLIDALKGIFYNDDKQLIHQCSNKKYGEPKVIITLEQLENNENSVSR